MFAMYCAHALCEWVWPCTHMNMTTFTRYAQNCNTIGRFLIVWFNDCVLGKSGQIANPIIAMVDPVLYCSIRARLFVNLLIANAGTTRNSQLIDTRN